MLFGEALIGRHPAIKEALQRHPSYVWTCMLPVGDDKVGEDVVLAERAEARGDDIGRLLARDDFSGGGSTGGGAWTAGATLEDMRADFQASPTTPEERLIVG